jgi:hypothetical protein
MPPGRVARYGPTKFEYAIAAFGKVPAVTTATTYFPSALLRICAEAVAAENVPDEFTMLLHPVRDVFVGHAISE